MDTFILALQLFTSIPVSKPVEVSDRRLIKGVLFWPVIGWIIGLFDVLVYIAARAFLPRPAAAAAGILAELWMTRGFHLDGLCDTADAFFSSRSKERMLEIMKDSQAGTFGVIAVTADLGLRFLFLTVSARPLLLLAAAPAAGKMVQALLMYRVDYPRENGLGKSYIGRISACILAGSTFLGVAGLEILCVWAGGWRYAAVAPAVCLISLLYRRYVLRKIGGMTGDTMGAGSEIAGIGAMVVLTALEGGGWLWM